MVLIIPDTKMETPNSQRRSTRNRKENGLFQDYIQNVIFDDDEFITQDEIEEDAPDFAGM